MRIKSLKTFLLSTGAVACTAFSLSADNMTMQDAMNEALRTNPEIKADQAATRSNEHVIRRAEAGYYPAIDLRAGAGIEHTHDDYKANDMGTTRDANETRFRTDPTATLRQNIFDGFRTSTDVARAEAEKNQSDKKVEETMELVLFRVLNAYIDVRRFQRLMKLAQRNVKAHERYLGKVRQQISGGRASETDKNTVLSRLFDAKTAVVDLEGDLGSAVARFIDVVGVEPGDLTSAEVSESYLPNTVEEAIQIALENNRSVKLANSSIGVANAELDATDVPFWPTLTAELEAQRADNTSGRNGHTDAYRALAVLRWNILNGGADAARQREVTETVAETRHREAQAKRTAEREVRVSWSEMKSAHAQAVQLRESVHQKWHVKDGFEKQFDLGTRSLLDLLDAENDYFLVKGSLITVESTWDLTAVRLLASMGVLGEKFGVTRGPVEGTSDAFMQNAGAFSDFFGSEGDFTSDVADETTEITEEQASEFEEPVGSIGGTTSSTGTDTTSGFGGTSQQFDRYSTTGTTGTSTGTGTGSYQSTTQTPTNPRDAYIPAGRTGDPSYFDTKKHGSEFPGHRGVAEPDNVGGNRTTGTSSDPRQAFAPSQPTSSTTASTSYDAETPATSSYGDRQFAYENFDTAPQGEGYGIDMPTTFGTGQSW